MTTNRDQLIQQICDAINTVKKTAYEPAAVTSDLFLGGDLGVDSIEMLEIWFSLEKALGFKIADDDKRDIYTIDNVVDVLLRYLSRAQSSPTLAAV